MEPRGSKMKTKEQVLHERLRELIESGEWPDGHLLPSEAELVNQYGMMSRISVRNAVMRLADAGLVLVSQGRCTRVYQPEPLHQIIVYQRTDPASGPARVAEPGQQVVSFLQGLNTAPMRRHWDVDSVVPGRYGRRLGLEPHAIMLRRTLVMSNDIEPVLMASSFLPINAAGETAGWLDGLIGDLAVFGLPATAGHVTMDYRAPMIAEAKALAIPRGIPVFVLSRPYQVLPGADPSQSMPAGVLVVARSDRVCVSWLP
jgi:DNA-binding GntR family transcriptional regulator